MYLSSNQLSGEIPPELGNLASLTVLFLSDNRLSGTIPPELGNLTNLEGLSLWGNELSGSIPSELTNLTNLDYLILGYGNQFSGCIPETWRNIERNGLEELGLPICVTPSPILTATDREVLVVLYQTTDGPNWLRSDNWLTDAPIDTWYGVNTDINGRVIELSLSENGLSGVIPSELGNLSHLEWLALYDNELGGAIPSELGNLTNLIDLYLHSNQLTGVIPSELGNLANLEDLALSINRLSGSVPSELGKLLNLTRMFLSRNRLSGMIPPELGSLTRLEALYFAGNQLSGCVPGVWRSVEENDLEDLGLPFCVASATTSSAVTVPLTSVQIFGKVSPAIAFVETAISTGSGVLVEGGYLVTNAHVVWPFNEARVVFPDGTEFHQVPVIGWDNLADLAVLGPISSPAKPVTLIDGENLPIGADVYLIGYPGEFEDFPQPAIGRGLLARLREWKSVGITYFQTDAIAIGGQSGGALVSETGDVIGISGFRITEGKFGFVASSADLLPRIRQLIAGEDPSGLGNRRLPIEVRRHRLKLRNYWDDLVFVIDEPVGTRVEVELTGERDGKVTVHDSFGENRLDVDEEDTDTQTGSFVVRGSGPHFLVVRQLVELPAQFTLEVNRRIVPFADPDRGGRIQVGKSVRGNVDFPGDVDHFLLQLEENETVEIIVRSALADVVLTVDYLGAVEEQIVQDDDSGGGLFGLDSRIVYRAPHSGSYFVVVRDASRSAPGGYVVSVKPAGQEADSRSSASSGPGCDQIRPALDELLASFTSFDPDDIERSPEDMIEPVAEEQYSHLVVFLQEDRSQMIIVACGQIGDVEQSAYDLQLSELKEALHSGPITERENDVLTRLQLLEMSPVGDISFGTALDSLSNGEQARLERISFRRGNFVVLVSSLSYPQDDAQEIVPAEQVARALDAQMSAYLSGE